MRTTDSRGVPVSTTSDTALAAYEIALRQYQTYVGDPIATIEVALGDQPDFMLGHLFRAGVLMTYSEARFAGDAKRSIATAAALHGNDRERALLAALQLLVDGEWHDACATLDRVLVAHPRDVFAIQTAHLFDFFRGDALNLRNRIMRVLPHWSPDVPGYSFLLGMHAFGLEECNQYAEAEATAQRALAIERRDAWSVHAGVHVMEMTSRIDDGIEWLETRRADWSIDNGFAFHLYWHLALFHLDRGAYARVLALYDTAIHPTPTQHALPLVDATALLWRLHLLDVDVGTRFAGLADEWQAKLEDERGYYAFNDAHAMFAFAAVDRSDAIARLFRDMESATATNAAMTHDVGVPIARAAVAFTQGRYDDVLDLLVPVRDIAHRFGGSHAQRDIITLTIIEAALRANHRRLAAHYIAERTVARPRSGLGWRLHARV